MAGILRPGDSYFPILPAGVTSAAGPPGLPGMAAPRGPAVLLGQAASGGGGGEAEDEHPT